MSFFPENVYVELYTIVAGQPTWTNISGDIVSPIIGNLGFSDGDQLSRLAPGSDMRFDLNNIASAYDPSSTFYKGQKIRLRIQYGSLIKTKFFGYIDHIGLDVGTWGARQAHVVCIDWLALAARTPIRALAGMTNTTIDLAVAALIAQMQIQPERTDFEIGQVSLPSVFDQVTVNSTVYSELQNLVMGEWGYIYMRDGGETLKVESSLSRIGDGSDYKTTSFYIPDGVPEDFLLPDGTNFLLPDGTNFLLPGEPTAASFNSDLGEEYTNIAINHGDLLTNKILASAVPVVIGGSTQILYPFNIANGSKAILIASNSDQKPFIFQGQYKDPTAGGAQVSGSSVITPVVSTDWTFNSKIDGTGTDLSANLTITFTAGQSGFKASIINAGATGYLTKFNVRGIAIYRYSPVETVFQDQRSIWDYGDYTLQFTRQYGASSNDILPFMFRLIMRDRRPRTIFSDPKFNGFDELDHLAGFMILDIGDQIRLASTKPSSDALYYIQGVKFTIQPGSEAITFDYVTTETIAGAVVGITEAAMDFAASASLRDDGINFGVLPSVSNHTYRSIVARIYLSNPESQNPIFSIYGFAFRVVLSAGSYYLQLNRAYSTTEGVWRGNPAVSADVWTNIVLTINEGSTSNVPKIYINGAAVAVSTLTPPVGTPTTETGHELFVGGYKDELAIGGSAFNGKIESLAEYNRILTPAEVTTIHNGGVYLPFASHPQAGLKFFFGGMDDESYAEKLDTVLSPSDTIYELVNGFAGMPLNGPTLRAVG